MVLCVSMLKKNQVMAVSDGNVISFSRYVVQPIFVPRRLNRLIAIYSQNDM